MAELVGDREEPHRVAEALGPADRVDPGERRDDHGEGERQDAATLEFDLAVADLGDDVVRHALDAEVVEELLDALLGVRDAAEADEGGRLQGRAGRVSETLDGIGHLTGTLTAAGLLVFGQVCNNISDEMRRAGEGMAHRAAVDLQHEAEAACRRQRRAAFGDFCFRKQHVQRPGIEINPHPVAVPQNRKAAACRSLRRTIENGWRARSAGLPAIPHARERAHPFLQKRGGSAHIDDFGSPRIAQRARAPHEENGVLINAQLGIIDCRVVVFRSVENDGLGLESVRVFWI